MRDTDVQLLPEGVPRRPPRVRPPLVIGCGALARELVELTRRAGLPPMDLTCLPASLHNRPERIPGAVQARIQRARRDGYDRIFVAYADCGTGGMLDRVLEEEAVARLEGAHCYEVYAGRAAFAALHDEEPGTFYLTDYLVRNFDRLVIRGLGLDRHPELLPIYFGNYRRLVYLAQVDDPALTSAAQAAAGRLGLAFERRLVGLGEIHEAVRLFAAASDDSQTRFLADEPRSAAGNSPSGRFVDSQTRFRARRAGSSQEQARFGPVGAGSMVPASEFMTVRQRSASTDQDSAGNGRSAPETLSHKQRRAQRRGAWQRSGPGGSDSAISGTAA